MTTEELELKALLEENLKVAQDNNRLLREARRMGRIAFWAKVVIWTALIIVPLLLLGSVMSSFGLDGRATQGTTTIMGMPSAQMIDDALKLYTGQE